MPSHPHSLEIVCSVEADTQQLGNDIALALRAGDLITLIGDLGAGKTTLARALIRAASGDPYLEVPSPTFTLAQIYNDLPFGSLAHMDFYRLEAPQELEELGFDEALQNGVVLAEWPDKADINPEEASLCVSIEIDDDDARTFIVSGQSEPLARLTRSLEIREFMDHHGYGAMKRKHLTGDASARSYETIFCNDKEQNPLILMNAPTQPDGPPIRDGKPYSQIAQLAENMTAFAGVDQMLDQAGFTVPKLHATDLDGGLLIIGNLGTGSIIDTSRQPIEERYSASVSALVRLHETQWPPTVELDSGVSHTVPNYDRDAMSIELDLLPSWYCEHVMGQPLNEAQAKSFWQIWDKLITKALQSEQSLVLRDYHSPNIIWRKDEQGTDRIGLIDFQDAVIGPTAYDVGSLAQDARVDVSHDLEQKLIDTYCQQRQSGFNEQSFREAVAIMSAQRATKILGIFVRLSKRDGKDAYLAHLPRIESYLKRACAHPSLAELKHWVETVLKI